MAERDHYGSLGVGRFASAAVVRRAYIALMKAHHAGVEPLPDDRLRVVGEAYWTLRHPGRRELYDAHLHQRDRRLQRATATGARRVLRSPGTPVRDAPPVRTRLLFLMTSLAVAAGTWWAWAHWQPPSQVAPRVEAAGPTNRTLPTPRLAMIDDAVNDYYAIALTAGPAGIARRIDSCFTGMRTSAPAAVFDYCTAFEAVAAGERPADPLFAAAIRAERLTRIDFQPASQRQARWEAVNRAVAARAWPVPTVTRRPLAD